MMLSDPRVIARRKKIGLATAALASCAVAVRSLVSDRTWTVWPFVGLAFVIIANAGIIFLAWPGSGRLLAWSESDMFLIPARVRAARKGGPRGPALPGPGLTGYGPLGAAGRAPAPTGRWLALRALARLMPPAAGRRWLAEAESLLFELPPGRRSRAVSSYLWSAPRLMVLMWTNGLFRRSYPRSRRRG